MTNVNVLQKTDAAFFAVPTGEHLEVVVAGHVDHGKSTVIGRLLADAGVLPEGKIERIRAQCERNARPFEYAFLLDALKNEQAQGITIDTARCFFRTEKRHYVIRDAPGHIEFLKNMVTGAAGSEAALLVIDAREGIRENSRRHGYLLSLLGLRQLAVVVNKMDLVDFDEDAFLAIEKEFGAFLTRLGIAEAVFIPVCAQQGGNLVRRAPETPWYNGNTVLEQLDAFRKPEDESARPFRLPVQDIYKFTEQGDDRRIVAGTVETGTLRPGGSVCFLPSGKTARIRRIERFGGDSPESAGAGEATGVTLDPEIYVKPGELMVREGEAAPHVGNLLRVNLFWMGIAPLITGKRYKLKLGAARVAAELVEIRHVLDATELTTVADKAQVERHDVAECVLETLRPVAFDTADVNPALSRFVLVDDFEIAGCGVVLAPDESGASVLRERVKRREFSWETGAITRDLRIAGYGHAGKFIIFVCPGPSRDRQGTETASELAKALERRLFATHKHTYYMSIRNVFGDFESPGADEVVGREEHLLQLGQLARVMTDSGLLFITVLPGADDTDLAKLRLLNEPNELFVVAAGECDLAEIRPDVTLRDSDSEEDAIQRITQGLNARNVIPDYSI
jgi:bifunctional enzyme CysN/CysC